MDVQLTEATTERVYPDTYEGVARTDERFAAIAAVLGNGDPVAEYEAAIREWESPLPDGVEAIGSFNEMVDRGAAMVAWIAATAEQLGVPVSEIHLVHLG